MLQISLKVLVNIRFCYWRTVKKLIKIIFCGKSKVCWILERQLDSFSVDLYMAFSTKYIVFVLNVAVQIFFVLVKIHILCIFCFDIFLWTREGEEKHKSKIIYDGSMLFLVLRFVLWCPLRFPHKKTIFGSYLPPVVCRRVHVLFALFVLVCV